MFRPPIFQPTDTQKVLDFVKHNGFAIVVSQQNNVPIATHIPLIVSTLSDGRQILHGHISKANPQWQNWTEQSEVLAIFNGPHAYVSSSWYDHPNVPTWNYIAVHIYGKPRILEGDELVASVSQLVEKYEDGRPNRFQMKDLPEKVLKREFRGIVGLEIEITRVEAAYKLSQNRNERDYKNIIAELEKDGDTEVADAMRKRKDY